MGLQTGVITLKGSVGNLRFYKVKGQKGSFASTKGGASKSQIMTSPSLARTRENMSEFGGVALVGKAIRNPLLETKRAWDKGVTGRLVTALKKINLLDVTSQRGQRAVQITQFPLPLLGFEFNQMSHFGVNFRSPYTLSIDTGRTGATLKTQVIDANSTVLNAGGATHFRLGLAIEAITDYFYNPTEKKYVPSSGGAAVNGLSAIAWTDYQDVTNTALPGLTLHATLPQVGTPPAAPTMTPDVSLIVSVVVELFQQVSGKYYLLETGYSMRIDQIATH